MPNPWPTRVHDYRGPVPFAGAKRNVVTPLTLALYHYDLTQGDGQFVWQDGAGTIPAADLQDINRVDDRGSAGFDVIDVVPTFPIWRANELNGLGAFTTSGAGLTAGVPPVLPVDGASFFQVMRRVGGGTGTIAGFFSWTGSGNSTVNFQFIPTNSARINFLGTGFQNLKIGGIGSTETYWVFARIDGAGNYYLQLAGEPPVTGTASFDAGSLGNLFLSPGPMHGFEALFWDFPLSDAQRDFMIDYAENKYGGVFPIP